MPDTNNLRLLTGGSRAHHFVPLTSQAFAQIVRQAFEVLRDILYAVAVEKLQARLKTMQQRRRPRAGFPRKRAAIPALFEIEVVIRVWNARPTHQCRLNPFASAIGKI